MKVIRKQTIDTEQFELGDEIRFKLTTGEEVNAKVVQKCEDGMLFITNGCIEKEMPMYENLSKEHLDYLHSDLRKYLNTKLLHFFPEDIRSRMVPTISGDYLSIPTERQIFGKNIFGDEESYTRQFHCMKHLRNRMVFEGTEEKEYWLQDYVSNNAFACVYPDGSASFSNAARFRCVRVVFELSNTR